MIKVNGREIKFSTFPNNETLLKNQFGHIVDKSSVVVKFKYENDSDLIKLMLVKNEIDLLPNSFKTLRIMYYPYSRMDRGSNDICFTLKHIAEFINRLNFDRVIILEPHSDICVDLTNNSQIEYITPTILNEIKDNIEFDYIVLPDKGAYNRYKSMLSEYNIIHANKVRDFETGKILSLDIIDEVDSDKNAIILDDLSSFGGTFLWTAQKLREKGIKNIYLIIAHAEESILKGKIPESDLIKKVFTTNSIINKSKETKKIKIMEVI